MKNKKLSFAAMYLLVGIIPALLAIVISTYASMKQTSNSFSRNVFEKLNVAAESLANYYEYDIKNDILTYEEDYVDSLLDQGIELTVFKDDTRFMTSIYKEGGDVRNTGTQTDPAIYEKVKNGGIVEDDNVMIGGERYYVVYRPMYDANNNFWGMAFAGCRYNQTIESIRAIQDVSFKVSAVLIIIITIIIIILANFIKKPMLNTVKVLQVLSDGNINETININSSIKELNDIIIASSKLQQVLKDSVDNIKNSTSQLNTSVDNVATETSENVESVSQINTAINEVATTSQSVSYSAITLAEKAHNLGDEIDNLVRNTDDLLSSADKIKNANNETQSYMNTMLDSSNKSVVAVDDIVKDINNTYDAVKEIEKVVEMIEEIASETKLLSLNASIEAAHAGDAGRGFAVVAENIKQLAESSSNNVNKISEIIEKIVSISSKSVNNAETVKNIIDEEQKYIANVLDKFNVLSENVDNSIEKINDISNKTNNLDVIKKEVSDETESLSAISEELGASAEEVSASCQTVLEGCENTLGRTKEMKDIGSVLTEAVDFFK